MRLLNAAHLSPDSVTRAVWQAPPGGSSYPCPLGAARNAGLQVYMPSREVIHVFQPTADVQQPSVGARNGYPHRIAPRPPCQVV